MRFSNIIILIVIFSLCIITITDGYFVNLASSSLETQDWAMHQMSYSDPPIINILKSTSDSLSINIECFGFLSNTIQNYTGTYKRIQMKDCFNVTKVGHPELPYIRKLVAIPECKDIHLTFSIIDTVVINNINIYPAPMLVEERDPFDCITYVKEVFVKNDEIYKQDDFYPKDIVKIEKTFKIRNQRVAELYIYPLQYNPYLEKAIFTKNIEINVNYESPIGPVCVSTGPFESVCTDVILNYVPEFGMTTKSHQILFYGDGMGRVDSCIDLSGCSGDLTPFFDPVLS